MQKRDSFGKFITNNKTGFIIGDEFDSITAQPKPANKLSKSLNEETEIRTKELLYAYNQIAFQNQEKEKRAAELLIANQKLTFENHEKEKRADELYLANEELKFQNQEKKNRASELVIANFELAFQNQEKKNKANELVKANKELAFLNNEKIKKAMELIITNNEITNQIKLRAEENLLFDELKKTEKKLTSHIKGLEKIIFMTSHEIRHPIANILGLIELMTCSIYSPEEMHKQIEYLKRAAITLDDCTKELTLYMQKLQYQKDELNN